MAHSRAQEEEAESTLPEMQETRPGIDQSAKERKNGGRGASLMDWILRKEPCKHKALLPADRPSHQGRDKNKNNTVKAKETAPTGQMESIIGNSSTICSLEALVTAGVVKALKSRPLTGQ